VLNNADREFAEGSLPPGTYGEQPGAQTSGFAFNSMLRTAKDMVLPYAKAWQHAISLQNTMRLLHYRDRLAPFVMLTVPRHAEHGGTTGEVNTLTTEDIDRVGTFVMVELDDVGPDDKQRLIATANEAVAGGIWSQEEGMVYSKVKNPMRMLGKILAEKGMQHPLVMEMLIIPQAFQAQGMHEMADFWVNMVVGPKLAQLAASGMVDPAAAQGGGGEVAGMEGMTQDPSVPQPQGQSQPEMGAPPPAPGGPAPGQGRIA
jgi:hypothetical protein